MISIVIPAYNEENAIADTVERALNALKQIQAQGGEVIVVDDGSSDRTGEIAVEAGARLIRHPHNIGYGRALKDGISQASCEWVVITDADGTYPIEQIRELIAQRDAGFDMVVGARTGKEYRESFLKSTLRHILRWLVEFTAGRKIPDINSGFRIFRRATVLRYFPQLCDTFSFTTSMTLAYMMTGKFVKYVDIPYEKRIGATKVRLFRDMLRTLQYIVQAILYYNPLKIFILFSAICLLISLFSFVGGVLFQIRSAFFLGVGSVLCSLLIFSMGLLADLLRQIMHKD